jgi:hypothetical protein
VGKKEKKGKEKGKRNAGLVAWRLSSPATHT